MANTNLIISERGNSPYTKGHTLIYGDGDYSLEPPVPYVTNSGILHTVKEGETLQSIAFRYYGDSGLWYIILENNLLVNPFEDIKPGVILKIPKYV